MDRNFLQRALSVINGLGQQSQAKDNYNTWKDRGEVSPASMASLVAAMGNNPYGGPYLSAAEMQHRENEARRKGMATEEATKMDNAMAAIRAAQQSGYQITDEAMPRVIESIGRGRAPALAGESQEVSVPFGNDSGMNAPVNTPMKVQVPGQPIFERKPQSTKMTNIKPSDDGWLYGLNAEGQYVQVPGSEGLATSASKYYGIGYKGNELWGINQTTGKYERIEGSEGVKKYDPNKPKSSGGGGGGRGDGLTRAQSARISESKGKLGRLNQRQASLKRELDVIPNEITDNTIGSPNYGRKIPNPAKRAKMAEIQKIDDEIFNEYNLINAWETKEATKEGPKETSNRKSGFAKPGKPNKGGGF